MPPANRLHVYCCHVNKQRTKLSPASCLGQISAKIITNSTGGGDLLLSSAQSP
jgi:hypothetical protein